MGPAKSTRAVVDTSALSTVWESLEDIWDHPIWAAAVTGQAQYVVSDNTHDFPPAQPDGRHVYNNVEYISSTGFITLLT